MKPENGEEEEEEEKEKKKKRKKEEEKRKKKKIAHFFVRVQANLHLRLVSLLMNIKSLLQEHHNCVSKMTVNAKMTCR